MFLMVLDNNNKVTSLNSEYIKQISIDIKVFNDKELKFNSVFLDNKSNLYFGIGVEETMPNYIYGTHNKVELELLLVTMITKYINSSDNLVNIDSVLFDKLHTEINKKNILETKESLYSKCKIQNNNVTC